MTSPVEEMTGKERVLRAIEMHAPWEKKGGIPSIHQIQAIERKAIMSESRHKASFVATVVLLACMRLFGGHSLAAACAGAEVRKTFQGFQSAAARYDACGHGDRQVLVHPAAGPGGRFRRRRLVAFAGRTRLLTTWGTLVWLIEMLLIGLIMLAMFVPLNDLITEPVGRQMTRLYAGRQLRPVMAITGAAATIR